MNCIATTTAESDVTTESNKNIFIVIAYSLKIVYRTVFELKFKMYESLRLEKILRAYNSIRGGNKKDHIANKQVFEQTDPRTWHFAWAKFTRRNRVRGHSTSER